MLLVLMETGRAMKITRVTAFFIVALLSGCATTSDRDKVPVEDASAPVIEKMLVEKSITETMEITEKHADEIIGQKSLAGESPPVEKVPSREKPAREIQRDGSQEDKATDRKPVARDIKPLTVSQELFLERNENNLLRVYVDMNKPRVLAIMSDHSAGGWVNPCKEERLVDSRGNVYEVMFYLARRPSKFRPLNEHLMTPVVFLNDRVYTIGRYGLKKLRANSQLADRQVHGCRSI